MNKDPKPILRHYRTHLSVIAGASLCFFLRISLWPFGLLEEFGLSLAYSQRGLRGFTDNFSTFSGRPLALVPSYLGLFLSNGGFAGQYAVAGIVSVSQFIAMLWAFSPLLRDYRFRWGLALIVATNPLWPAGFLLRYQSAQLSITFFVIWLGFAIRSADERRRGLNWLFGALALVVGLLSYPAIAIVPFLLLAPLCIYPSLNLANKPSKRRIITICASTSVAVAISTIYTAKVAPWIWSAAYEGSAPFPHLSDLGSLFLKSQRTLLSSRPFLSIFSIGAFLLLIPIVYRSSNRRDRKSVV